MITITDLANHRLLTILKDDKQVTSREFIQNILENIKRLVTSVVINMNQSYRVVIKQELPLTSIIINKFHVI